MKILALDPGITTGYALFTITKIQTDELVTRLDYWGNLEPEDLKESILVTFAFLYPDLKVIREKVAALPGGDLQAQLATVTNFLGFQFPNAYVVLPGVWKTQPSLFSFPLMRLPGDEHPPTQHQKDAYYLGLWYSLQLSGYKPMKLSV